MQIMVRAPEEVKDFLKNKAKSIGITTNALILVILQEWIQQKRKEEQDGRESGR